MLSGITTLFFDFGGTLAYSAHTRLENIRNFLGRLGFSPRDEDIIAGMERAEEYVRDFRSRYGYRKPRRERHWYFWCRYVAESALPPGADVDLVAGKMYRSMIFPYRIYPETIPTLKMVRSLGYKAGIISNWDAPTLRRYCTSLGITRFFDVILPSREAECDKPGREIFEMALDLIGSSPSESVHISDSYEADVLGAAGAGITPIWINRNRDMRRDSCITVYSLDEIFNHLQR